jgi:outer membrane receptor for monomeric catechols
VAAFYSEKYNERNTDPDTAAAQELLSGKRHAAGMEFNLAGRITPKWEVFFNHTWIPDAKIDQSNVVHAANGGGAQVQGDRPGLTPKHSGSVWSTYAGHVQACRGRWPDLPRQAEPRRLARRVRQRFQWWTPWSSTRLTTRPRSSST